MLEEIIAIIKQYESRTFYKMVNYSQFTIDAIEEIDLMLNDDETEFHENEGSGSVSELIGGIAYQVGTIIDVLKEGADKELFQDLLHDIRNLEESQKKKPEIKTLPLKNIRHN